MIFSLGFYDGRMTRWTSACDRNELIREYRLKHIEFSIWQLLLLNDAIKPRVKVCREIIDEIRNIELHFNFPTVLRDYNITYYNEYMIVIFFAMLIYCGSLSSLHVVWFLIHVVLDACCYESIGYKATRFICLALAPIGEMLRTTCLLSVSFMTMSYILYMYDMNTFMLKDEPQKRTWMSILINERFLSPKKYLTCQEYNDALLQKIKCSDSTFDESALSSNEVVRSVQLTNICKSMYKFIL